MCVCVCGSFRKVIGLCIWKSQSCKICQMYFVYLLFQICVIVFECVCGGRDPKVKNGNLLLPLLGG